MSGTFDLLFADVIVSRCDIHQANLAGVDALEFLQEVPFTRVLQVNIVTRVPGLGRSFRCALHFVEATVVENVVAGYD